MRDVSRLRRSRTDRYIAGVAGGLGRHFDVDPTVIRVVLAVLTFFGGAGVLVYGAVWLFVPEDGKDRAPIEVGSEARRIILLVAAVIAVSIVFGTPFLGNSWRWGAPFPLLLVGLVAVAIFATRDQRPDRNQPPPPWGSSPAPTPQTPSYAPEGTPMTSTGTYTDPGYQQPPPAWMPPPAPAYVPPPRPRRTGLVLFWPTVALIAIALGTLGIFDTSGAVPVSAYAVLAVAITAVMLLVGAFVGRPGGLIALGLVATVALGVTSAIDSATGGDTSGETVRATPTSAALVQDEYRIQNGELTLDLTGVTDLAALDGRDVDLRLYAGEIRVILPPGLNAEVDADLSLAGDISIDNEHLGGFDPSLNRTVTGSTDPGAPTVNLDIDVRIGQITVEQD
jgi:phage shock protein PspC (stress-responsive transcriptional regulator)